MGASNSTLGNAVQGPEIDLTPPVSLAARVAGAGFVPKALLAAPLKAHSETGASSAHRWFVCPGSVALSRGLPERSSTEANEGTAAHTLGSDCLRDGSDAWEHTGRVIEVGAEKFPVDTDMTESVQLYLNTIRAEIDRYNADFITGKAEVASMAPVLWIEERFHLSEIDEGLYGTADFAAYFPLWRKLLVVDYKHGVGIGVDATENPQLQYYAVGVVSKLPDTAEVDEIELVIVQPRHEHPDGLVRRWKTTFDSLGEWMASTLRPRLLATRQENAPLVAGDHCRFCPAKAAGICPVLNATFDDVAAAATDAVEATTPAQLETWELADRLAKVKLLKFVIKALEDEAYQRMLKGEKVPGFKLVPKKADRVWKDGSLAVLQAKFGGAAYAEPKVRSPAQVEKLDGGDAIVAAWAYKPDNGLSLADDEDRRHAVPVRSPTDRFAGVLTKP